jgi:hypothetical protein
VTTLLDPGLEFDFRTSERVASLGTDGIEKLRAAETAIFGICIVVLVDGNECWTRGPSCAAIVLLISASMTGECRKSEKLISGSPQLNSTSKSATVVEASTGTSASLLPSRYVRTLGVSPNDGGRDLLVPVPFHGVVG